MSDDGALGVAGVRVGHWTGAGTGVTVLLLPDGTVGSGEIQWLMLIADASGHGPSAAVVSAMVDAIVATAPEPIDGPARILETLKERDPLLRLVSVELGRNGERDHVIKLEAEIDFADVVEALGEEPGGGQQGHRQGNLADRQPGAEA